MGQSTGDAPNANAPASHGLKRHAERRRQGIPTVSVLVGPVGSAISTWREHFMQLQQRTLVVRELPAELLDALWLQDLDDHLGVASALTRSLAQHLNRTSDELASTLQNKSSPELEAWLDQTFPDDRPPSFAWLCRTLIPWLVEKKRFAEWLAKAPDKAKTTRLVLQALAQVVPCETWSALLLLRSEPSNPAGWLQQASHALTNLAVSVPRLPLAMHVEEAELPSHLLAWANRREGAILREGIIRVAPLRPLDAWHYLPDGTPRTNELIRTVEYLTAQGAGEHSLKLLARVVQATATAIETPDEADRARSEAERFLFACLENHPLFAGQFVLNKRISLPGEESTSVEVDLVAEQQRIAIEIDGYYHFREPDAYRRDRRKDIALQLADFTVLRFLAEDVVSRLEEIFSTIEQVWRRRPVLQAR